MKYSPFLLAVALFLLGSCTATQRAQRRADRHLRKLQATLAAYPEISSPLDTTYQVELKSLPQQRSYRMGGVIDSLMARHQRRDSVSMRWQDGTTHHWGYQIDLYTDSLSGEPILDIAFDSLAARNTIDDQQIQLKPQPLKKGFAGLSFWQKLWVWVRHFFGFIVVFGIILLILGVIIIIRR